METKDVKLYVDGKEIPVFDFRVQEATRKEEIPDFGDFVSDNFMLDGKISLPIESPAFTNKFIRKLRKMAEPPKYAKPQPKKQPFYRKAEYGRNRWGR